MTNIQHLREDDEQRDAQEHSESEKPQNNSKEADEADNAEGAQSEDQEKGLLELEKSIRDIGDQLRDLHYAGLKQDHSDLEQRKAHEDQRTELRKRLIETAQEHKDLLAAKEKAEL